VPRGSRICSSVLATFALFASLLAPAASASRTPPARDLPLPSFGQMLVDPVHDRVFVSGGGAGDGIVVLDFDGAIVATIAGQPGASGMVLHGGLLYVALPMVPAIALIDAATLTPVSRVLLPPAALPWDLVEAGGRLWFQQTTFGFGSFDLETYGVDLYAEPRVASPRFATSPADPDLLLLAEGGPGPATVHRLDLGASPFRVVASRTLVGAGSANDVRVSPGGHTFWLASGAPYEIGEFRVDDLSPTGTAYATGAYPNAVDYSRVGRGTIVAGVSWNSEDSVQVFRRGRASVIRTFAVPGNVLPMGVRFSPDARSIFVVSAAVPGASPTFHVFRNADRSS
jgi:hypothetical protein